MKYDIIGHQKPNVSVHSNEEFVHHFERSTFNAVLIGSYKLKNELKILSTQCTYLKCDVIERFGILTTFALEGYGILNSCIIYRLVIPPAPFSEGLKFLLKTEWITNLNILPSLTEKHFFKEWFSRVAMRQLVHVAL